MATDLTGRLLAGVPCDDDIAAWAASGAMALTGHPDGRPLLAPRSLMPSLRAVAGAIEASTGRIGRPVIVDAPALLGERAALAGLRRGGRTSCGGASRLVSAADRWIALSLPRADDVALVPAWFDDAPVDAASWPAVEAAVARRRSADLVERAALLGLACAALGEAPAGSPAVLAEPLAPGPATGDLSGVLVVNLASLWAGPLCANVLAAAGARVLKVESLGRPDGGRGSTAFFDLLHAGQESVALDFAAPAGVSALRRLLERADVVIEGSRPRALQQLGIDARAVAAGGTGGVWVSITGHGREGPAAVRTAYGDDGAVAGGLVAWDDDGPCFCGDAVADPLTGLTAATAVLDRLEAGGSWLVDVALARVAAWCAREPAPDESWTGPVSPPRGRPVPGPGPQLGADTRRVLDELGLG